MSYYEINENTARQAKKMMSFSDYREGSATAEYRRMVDAAVEIAEKQKTRVDPMYHEKIDALLDQYARRLASNMNRDYEIGTRCPSVMISGGSNFPVRKKEKQIAAWDKNREDYQQVAAILDKIRSTGTGGISSDDPKALEKLRKKLDALVKHQELMKAANAAIRVKDTAKGDAKLAELGYTPEEIKVLREPDFCGRIGYSSFELSNNNANIKRVRERLEKLEEAKEAEPVEVEHDGYTYKEDAELMRVQFFFDGKPDDEIRSLLKSNGFRWAPSQGAWQRQLTQNGKYAAKRVMDALNA